MGGDSPLRRDGSLLAPLFLDLFLASSPLPKFQGKAQKFLCSFRTELKFVAKASTLDLGQLILDTLIC